MLLLSSLSSFAVLVGDVVDGTVVVAAAAAAGACVANVSVSVSVFVI